MMNKKFLKTILFGGLFLSLTGAFVSCAEDYSDDIQNLQTQITTNSNAIAELQALLAKGVVITSVEKNAEGILLTLSDGSTQQLTNGANGKDGADGKDGQNGTNGTNGTNGKDGKDADVWTIDKDGFWCLNGEPTKYKAVAEDGANGGYYVPNAETGNFDYVDANGNKSDSGISWIANTMTAAQTETGVWFYNVDGKGGKIFVSTVAELKSLVFQPQIIIEGVEGMIANGVLIDDLNGNSFENNTIICSPVATASYHMNPSTVKEAGINKESLRFVEITRDYKVTRALTNVEATFNSIDEAKGMLTVNLVDFKFDNPLNHVDFSDIKEDGKLDLVALQVENAAGETITSDYATVDYSPIYTSQLELARTSLVNKESGHYFKSEAAAKEHVEQHINGGTGTNPTVIKICYTTANYDLYKDVRTCLAKEGVCGEFTQMATYHMNIKLTPISSFVVESLENGLTVSTDQQEFLIWDNGKVSARVYSEDGRAAIGRCPIVKAELCHENTVILTRWIVLEFVDEAEVPVDPVVNVYDLPINAFGTFAKHWNFCKGGSAEITAEQMNHVYVGEGISKAEFARDYEFYLGATPKLLNNDSKDDDKSYSTSNAANNFVQYVPNLGQVTSWGLVWTVDAGYLWSMTGRYPEAVAVYKHKTKESYVVLRLKTINPVEEREVLSFTNKGVKISEMWDEFNNGLFNVRTPDKGENTTKNCVFANSVLTLYHDAQDPATLVMKTINNSKMYKQSTSTGVSEVRAWYEFKSAKCGNKTLSVSSDGMSVYYGSSTIAELYAGDSVRLLHNDVAEEFLNTNELTVEFTVKSDIETCLGTMEFNPGINFTVRYIRPLNVIEKSAGEFWDGEDFGANHTLIKAADIVSLEDWRGKGVSLNENDAYRGYYGVNPVISLSADKPVTCNMVVEGVLKTIALPSHIKSGIVTSDMVDGTIIDASMVGTYFYYRNNGSTVDKDFSINFYVDVEYFWGTLSTSQVTVPVKATQRVNAPASK